MSEEPRCPTAASLSHILPVVSSWPRDEKLRLALCRDTRASPVLRSEAGVFANLEEVSAAADRDEFCSGAAAFGVFLVSAERRRPESLSIDNPVSTLRAGPYGARENLQRRLSTRLARIDFGINLEARLLFLRDLFDWAVRNGHRCP